MIKVLIAGAPVDARAELETLWVEPDENRGLLIWRAHVPVDRKSLQVEEIKVSLPARGGGS